MYSALSYKFHLLNLQEQRSEEKGEVSQPQYRWGKQFLMDGADPSRHVYNLKPGNFSFVN